MKSSVLAANIVCIKSVKSAVKSWSSRLPYSKCWNMFALNMLAASASKLKTTITSFKKPAPQSTIPKSFATESLLANIILGKYQYAMPLYRQESLFTQSGIELSRTTMARWVIQVSEKLKPLYAALKEHLLQQVVVQADETPLNTLKEENSVTCGSTARAQTRLMPHFLT